MSETLKDLYEAKHNDKVIALKDGNGFTLVSDYPEGRDGRSIFLRLYVPDETNGLLAGSVNRVESEETHGGYSLLDEDDPKGKVTNFTFDDKEGFSLKDGLVHHPKFKQPLSVSSFIDFLIQNHVSDKMGPIRRKQYASKKLLQLIFWLVDLKFDDVKLYDFEGVIRNIRVERDKTKQPEPFLKYFDVPRNMLGSLILFVALIATAYYCSFYIFPKWSVVIEPPEITNLLVVIYTASLFVLMEVIAKFLDNSIEQVDKNFSSWVGRLFATHYGFKSQQIHLDFTSAKKR